MTENNGTNTEHNGTSKEVIKSFMPSPYDFALDNLNKKKRKKDPANESFERYLEATFANNIPSYPLQDMWENVNHYHSTIYLAIQAMMKALSSASIGLEVKNKESISDIGNLSQQKQGRAQPSPQKTDDDYVPFEHQLNDYLRRPNPKDTFDSFISKCVLQYHLTGRLLIWAVPNQYELPVRFYVLPTVLCQPAYGLGSDLYPKGAWRVQQYYPASGFMAILPGPLSGTSGAIIDARNVYMMQNPHPIYEWAPFSPLVGVDTEADVVEMIDRSCWSVYQNGIRLTGIMDCPGASENVLQAMENRIQQKHAGPDNHGGIFFVGGGDPDRPPGKLQPLTPNPNEMSYETRDRFENLIIAAITGQDRTVIGLKEDGGSYSDRWAAIQDVRNRSYEPFLNKIANLLTVNTVEEWGLSKKGVRVCIKLPKLQDPTLVQADTNEGAKDGTMTMNEIRARRGMGPWTGENSDMADKLPATVFVAKLGQDINPPKEPPTTLGPGHVAYKPDGTKLENPFKPESNPAEKERPKSPSSGALPSKVAKAELEENAWGLKCSMGKLSPRKKRKGKRKKKRNYSKALLLYLLKKDALSTSRYIKGKNSKSKWISWKISKIMREGVRGKKVSQKQAVAIAHSMYKQKRKGKRVKAVPEIINTGPNGEKVEWLVTVGIDSNPEELQYKDTDGHKDGLNQERRAEMPDHFDLLHVPPIAVWKNSVTNQIEVVDGHKRLACAKHCGYPVIRGYFIEAGSADEAKEIGRKLNQRREVKAKDASGHEHEPAGSSKGGQFTGKKGSKDSGKKSKGKEKGKKEKEEKEKEPFEKPLHQRLSEEAHNASSSARSMKEHHAAATTHEQAAHAVEQAITNLAEEDRKKKFSAKELSKRMKPLNEKRNEHYEKAREHRVKAEELGLGSVADKLDDNAKQMVQAVKEAPNDQTAWLVAADAVEESGHEHVAARMREHVALTQSLDEAVKTKTPIPDGYTPPGIREAMEKAGPVIAPQVASYVMKKSVQRSTLPEYHQNEAMKAINGINQYSIGLISREELVSIRNRFRNSLPEQDIPEGDILVAISDLASGVAEGGQISPGNRNSRIRASEHSLDYLFGYGGLSHGFTESLASVIQAGANHEKTEHTMKAICKAWSEEARQASIEARKANASPPEENPKSHVDKKAATLLQHVSKVPKKIKERVGQFLSNKYGKLVEKYGKRGAHAVLAGIILLAPLPVPGSSLIPVAVAEAITRLKKMVKSEAKSHLEREELDEKEVLKLAREMLEELYKDMGEEMPSLDAPDDGEISGMFDEE